MKRIGALFLVCLLMMTIVTTAYAEWSSLAFVVSQKSDKVHLRAKPNGKSDSMGLYYNGTPAIARDEEWGEWVCVTIGTETGYMHRDMLVRSDKAESVAPKWRKASVKKNIKSANAAVHAGPFGDSDVIANAGKGEKLTVLGETVNRWSYVKYGNLYGYVDSHLLSVGNPVMDKHVYDTTAQPLALAGVWLRYSGVGNWSEELTVLPDGTFWAFYHDLDMGDEGEGYPEGTVYECISTGRFVDAGKVSDWEHRFEVSESQTLRCYEEVIEDGLRIVSIPLDFGVRESYSLYLPGAPQESLPQPYIDDMLSLYETDPTDTYGLYSSGTTWH